MIGIWITNNIIAQALWLSLPGLPASLSLAFFSTLAIWRLYDELCLFPLSQT